MVDIKSILKKIWYFIWEEDSILSWVVNIILAFIIVKFIIYPGLGLLMGTGYPVVAVVSESMEHRGMDFDDWWNNNNILYERLNINKEEFSNYKFANGFNKGDLMVVIGSNNIKKGDVIVFRGGGGEPIIHRVVSIQNQNGNLLIQTKGDNNAGSRPDEIGITKNRVLGVAKFRVLYLGWFKLGFLKLLGQA